MNSIYLNMNISVCFMLFFVCFMLFFVYYSEFGCRYHTIVWKKSFLQICCMPSGTYSSRPHIVQTAFILQWYELYFLHV